MIFSVPYPQNQKSLETCVAANKPRKCAESAFSPLFLFVQMGGWDEGYSPLGYVTTINAERQTGKLMNTNFLVF